MPLSLTFRIRRPASEARVQGGFEFDFEGSQVTIVDAHDLRAGIERWMQFFRVVNFDQRRHAEAGGQFAKVAHFASGENRGDQQDGVGSMRSGFDERAAYRW